MEVWLECSIFILFLSDESLLGVVFLETPEDHKRKEGLFNEPSSSSTPERPTVPVTHTYAMGELEGRLLKRIQAIESSMI